MFIIFFFLSPNIRLTIILNFYFIYRKRPIIRTWSHKGFFSKCYKMKFPDLVKICLWLHLTVKGLNSIKSDQCEKFLLFTSVLLYFKQSGYKNRPLSTYENSAWWHVLGHKRRKWTNVFIIFFFLSPNIRLTMILNFYVIYRKQPIIRTYHTKWF